MTAPQSPGQPARRPALADMLWMACFGAVIFAMVLALAAAMVPAAELPVPEPPAAAQATAPAAAQPIAPATTPPTPTFPPVKDPALLLVIETGSRLYPDWKEERRVHIGEHFVLADTKNEAFVEALYPDFRMVDGKGASIADSLGNPAIRVFVQRDSALVDSTWAFLNFPPHFSPKSFFTFQLKGIEGWTGRGTATLPAEAAPPTAAPQDAAVAAPAATQPPPPATAAATPSQPKKTTSPARKPE